MSQLINTTGIQTVNSINSVAGRLITKVRFVVKTKLGMTICDARDFQMKFYNNHPETLIRDFKKGVLQTVQVEFDNSDVFVTVFSRTGKNVKLIDEAILVDLKVGTINSMFYNTNLYDWQQYKTVKSKTWDSYAYQMNTTTSPVSATQAA